MSNMVVIWSNINIVDRLWFYLVTFGVNGMDHWRKIGEGHVFLLFVKGRVIQLF